MLAANHNPLVVDVHGVNFPDADHYCGDIAKADIAGFARADLFWSSPSCPPWTDVRGVRRDFDRSIQGVLFDFARDPVATDPSVARAGADGGGPALSAGDAPKRRAAASCQRATARAGLNLGHGTNDLFSAGARQRMPAPAAMRQGH
jgi:hypothetical protein